MLEYFWVEIDQKNEYASRGLGLLSKCVDSWEIQKVPINNRPIRISSLIHTKLLLKIQNWGHWFWWSKFSKDNRKMLKIWYSFSNIKYQ